MEVLFFQTNVIKHYQKSHVIYQMSANKHLFLFRLKNLITLEIKVVLF